MTWLSLTIGLSAACYFVALGVFACYRDCGGGDPARSDRLSTACGVWAAGAALLWVHITIAMHAVHHWDHAAAVADTARRTGELLGWEFGGGVYFNYLLAVLWTLDAARRLYALPRSLPWTRGQIALQSFFAMMFVNALIVFADGWPRVLGIAGFAALGAAVIARVRREPES